ncbi:MAG: hypothetical protein KJ614_15135 [Gammaproteobacteria bacterium]|nr:hypothetical protein [Rhodoferax sp.]MBU3900232.1 hypothetical protein [Gammaproteobacteria bacterium]MBU3997982.1 hypothetical protein [Gammaproteobacteria bacterium]MBU4079430.1 hypothetical protein [Gammaproteobacteria bacterium]MBU4114391.1 hypothetical protein [Gammaproteobacteria bacterium]
MKEPAQTIVWVTPDGGAGPDDAGGQAPATQNLKPPPESTL